MYVHILYNPISYMKSFRILFILSITFLTLGNRGCITNDTVILPEGPRAAELGKTKDEQIVGLTAQVKAEIKAREDERMQASLAAADFEIILFTANHLTPGLPRHAVEEEARLGKSRSPAPNPEEISKGKDRIIDILNGNVAAAQAAYDKAFDEATKAKVTIVAQNDEIAERDTKLAARATDITKLEADKKTEQETHKSDVIKAFATKDLAIEHLKDEYASKERATWVLWTRLAGLAFIVGGAVIAIVFHIVPEGAAFVGVGVLIGLVSIFIDWLTSQIWFPWLCGGIGLLILGLGGYALYRMWRKGVLQTKVTAALQDLKDESTTLGNDVWSKVSEHLDYRLGDKDGAAQKQLVASLGLINPKAEEQVKPTDAGKS